MSMFRTSAAESVEIGPGDSPGNRASDLIPVSVLGLDVPGLRAEGWGAWLSSRDIAVEADDIGRPAVAKSVARMLLAERREAEARAQEKRAELERQAIEADQERRANLWAGLPVDQIPVGMSPAEAMLAADYGNRPRRWNPVEAALDGESMTFHSYGQEAG